MLELSGDVWSAICMIAFGTVAFLCVAAYRYQETAKEDKRQRKYPKAKFSPSDPDVVIIGGGFTGSTLAGLLADDGRRVVVIERDMTPPETYRGEHMTPGGMIAFQKLGLEDLLKDVRGTRCDGFTFNDETLNISVSLPLLTKNGYMMRHGDLVRNLRKHAQTKDNVTYIEATGKDLIRENGRIVGAIYKPKGSEETKEIRAPLTVVCDGFFSTLRKRFTSLPKPKEPLAIMGLELGEVNFPNGKHWMHMFLGNPLAAYFVYSNGSGTFRILIEVNGESPKNVAGFLRDKLAPTMPEHIQKPVLEALDKRQPGILRVKNSVGTYDDIPPGVLVVGDAYDCRDPISGAGMTMALNDVMYWREALRDVQLDDDDAMMKERELFQKKRQSWGWAINALSHVFSKFALGVDVGTCRMRQQFMRALQQVTKSGDDAIKSTMDILNTVNTDPTTLKNLLEATRTDTIKYAFQSRSWISLFTAIQESLAIYFKFNEIFGSFAKEYSLFNN